MKQNDIDLKAINDILEESFYIPSFQRGYRWTKKEVEDLLEDIWEFSKSVSSGGDKERFYCLQPVVIKKNDKGEWEVIDGQQRLTTIYLILFFLNKLRSGLDKKRFKIRYDTRNDNGAFLDSLDCEKKIENVDYFHICEAYRTITNWFKNRDDDMKEEFLQTLLNDDEIGKNVKLIWYEIGENVNQIDVFTRLNVGKIPLTNAELIKALFLKTKVNNNENTDKNNGQLNELNVHQIIIANEWDNIERSLQNDTFWYFIYNNNIKYENRIEFIFELMVNEILKDDKYDPNIKNDPYYIFIVFNKKFGKKLKDDTTWIETEKIWKKVKNYFMTIEEWYNDREFYHLIGYLVNSNNNYDILKLKYQSNNKRKTEFRTYLKDVVKNQLRSHDFQNEEFTKESNDQSEVKENLELIFIRNLDYTTGRGHKAIKSILLLFNVITLLQNSESNIYFQFDRYHDEKWDLEHIRSVKSGKPGTVNKQKKWLNNVRDYFAPPDEILDASLEGKEEGEIKFINNIDSLLSTEPFNTNDFDKLYDDLLKYFDEEDEKDTDNSIANLTLLDASTNRSYKNAVFPIKRKKIIANDKTGTFVPICTKNVFLKYYSEKVSDMMHWKVEDRNDYIKAIIKELDKYLYNNQRL